MCVLLKKESHHIIEDNIKFTGETLRSRIRTGTTDVVVLTSEIPYVEFVESLRIGV